uniref:Bm11873 n=1 Tax=Brugia malayi TaxID=6279 RepID=A0A1I9G5H3_BRUMA|nr:Bm11873 [Brugia malayi]
MPIIPARWEAEVGGALQRPRQAISWGQLSPPSRCQDQSHGETLCEDTMEDIPEVVPGEGKDGGWAGAGGYGTWRYGHLRLGSEIPLSLYGKKVGSSDMIMRVTANPKKTLPQLDRTQGAWVKHPWNSCGKHPGTRTGAKEIRDDLTTTALE